MNLFLRTFPRLMTRSLQLNSRQASQYAAILSVMTNVWTLKPVSAALVGDPFNTTNLGDPLVYRKKKDPT